MAHPAFAGLTQSILSVLGEDALLRGVEPCRVNVERGVEITGEYGEVAASRDVATIANTLDPRVGDALTVDGRNYVLDALLLDNGYSSRFVIRPEYTGP